MEHNWIHTYGGWISETEFQLNFWTLKRDPLPAGCNWCNWLKILVTRGWDTSNTFWIPQVIKRHETESPVRKRIMCCASAHSLFWWEKLILEVLKKRWCQKEKFLKKKWFQKENWARKMKIYWLNTDWQKHPTSGRRYRQPDSWVEMNPSK